MLRYFIKAFKQFYLVSMFKIKTVNKANSKIDSTKWTYLIFCLLMFWTYINVI
jgi:hypothetical protein